MPAMEETLMPIGRFAKSCRLTIKALRHYHDIGLLKPAYVDPHSGYRYYNHNQAIDAIRIAMLRSLDIPISSVRKLLQCDATLFNALLCTEKIRIEQELEEKQRILNSLNRISDNGLMPYSVSIRQEPAFWVAQKTISTTPTSILKDSSFAITQLHDELLAQGRNFVDPVMCINGDPDKGEIIAVRACIGVNEPYPQLEQSVITEIAPIKVAWLVHLGPYEELGLAYHSIFAWIQEHGYEQDGEMREIYKNNPAEVPTDELQTEVMLPIK